MIWSSNQTQMTLLAVITGKFFRYTHLNRCFSFWKWENLLILKWNVGEWGLPSLHTMRITCFPSCFMSPPSHFFMRVLSLPLSFDSKITLLCHDYKKSVSEKPQRNLYIYRVCEAEKVHKISKLMEWCRSSLFFWCKSNFLFLLFGTSVRFLLFS